MPRSQWLVRLLPIEENLGTLHGRGEDRAGPMIECLVLFGAHKLYTIGGDDLIGKEVGKAFDQVCVTQLHSLQSA